MDFTPLSNRLLDCMDRQTAKLTNRKQLMFTTDGTIIDILEIFIWRILENLIVRTN